MSLLDLPPMPADAEPVILPGLHRLIGRTDYQQSVADGLTESFEDFCDRISGDQELRDQIAQLTARKTELVAEIARLEQENARLRAGVTS